MSNLRFLIENVLIDKFRGFNEKKEFKLFINNPVKKGIILLSGPNGFGKSSFIDAIEWCLTGKIKRLEEQFDKRKEKTVEKQKGLIRNTNTEGAVRVEIQGSFGEQKIKICREYKGNKDYDEGFLINKTKLLVYCNNDVIIDTSNNLDTTLDNLPFINYNISKLFYDRFVCSQEKTIHIYEKGRGGFYEMFSLFLGGTDEIEKIENNLVGYVNDEGKRKEKVIGLLEQIRDEKAALLEEITQKKNDLKAYTEQLSKYSEDLKNALNLGEIINSYPELLIYKGEKTVSELYADIEVGKVESRALAIQKNVLTSISKTIERQKVRSEINNIVEYLENRDKLDDYSANIYTPYKDVSEAIKICQNVDFDLICKQKETYQNLKIDMNSNSASYDERLLLIGERLDTFHKSNVTEYTSKKLEHEQLGLKVYEYNRMQTQLSSYSKADPIISALETLLDHIDGFMKYREQSNECPLCYSSENFNKEGFKLGENAQQALLKYDEERAILKDKIRGLQESIEEKFNKACVEINGFIQKEIEKVEVLISACNVTKDIKYSCTKHGLDFKEINEELLNKKLRELQNEVAKTEEYSNNEKVLLQSLLDTDGVLTDIPSKINSSYNATSEEFEKWSNKEKLNALKNYILAFSARIDEYELLVDIKDIHEEILSNKINTLLKIKDVLDGQVEVRNIKRLIEKYNNEINQKEQSLSDKKTIEVKLEEISSSVKEIRSSVDNEILNSLNIPLNYIFKRINRHNIYEKIELRKPTRGMSKNAEFNINNVHGQSSFIPNVLSTGQLSAITLSIFLTVAMGQRHLPFRCYFMDDPIQSMDDINTLSFIDLLRTELGPNVEEDKRFADQLYISTCNEDLEALIKHKAKHFGIGLSTFRFDGYGSFIGS